MSGSGRQWNLDRVPCQKQSLEPILNFGDPTYQRQHGKQGWRVSGQRPREALIRSHFMQERVQSHATPELLTHLISVSSKIDLQRTGREPWLDGDHVYAGNRVKPLRWREGIGTIPSALAISLVFGFGFWWLLSSATVPPKYISRAPLLHFLLFCYFLTPTSSGYALDTVSI